MELTEETLSKTYRYKGYVVNMRSDEVRLPDGTQALREVVEHPGGVGIALENENHEFYMVSQWRYAQGRVLREFPAGKREKGEDPLETARREIAEETGYEGEDFVDLGPLVPTGAYDTEVIEMYYAKAGRYVGQHFDFDENLALSLMTLDQIIDEIMEQKIIDAKTIAMAFKIREMKNRK